MELHRLLPNNSILSSCKHSYSTQVLTYPIILNATQPTIILPHATAYNASAAPEAMARIARALGVDDAAQGLFDLAKRLGAPTSLDTLGVKRADLDRVADAALVSAYPNPRPLEREAIRDLLEDAYLGRRPQPASETTDAAGSGPVAQ